MNPSQCVIVNDALVPKTNDGVAFNPQGTLLKALKLRGRDLATAVVRIFGTQFQLLDALDIFGAKPVNGIARKFIVGRELIENAREIG